MRTIRLLAQALLLAGLAAQCGATPASEVVREEVVKEVQVTVEVTKVVPKEVVVTATPEAQGPVTISFWHTYNPVETEALETKVIPAFEEANPNIKVEALAVPYDDFRKKLLTSMAGGTAPDLIRSDIAWVTEFAELGALVALDELMPDFDELAAGVFEAPLSTNFWEGHYWGLPLNTNTRVLVYNQELFEAAGIQAAPATFEEFTAACEKIKALGDDKYCFADGGTYGWAVGPWIWSAGGALTNPEVDQASGYLDSPETVAAYEYLKGLLDEGYLNPGILGGGVDAWGGFGTDQIAMLLEGPWFPPLFEGQYEGKPYGFALMPAGEGGSVSVVGGEDIVLFAQSQHKEAAAEFVRHILSSKMQLALAEAALVPVLKEAADSDFMRSHAFFGIFLEQLATANARPPHPNWPKYEEKLSSTGQAILSGEAGAEEALSALAAEVDALLAPE